MAISLTPGESETKTDQRADRGCERDRVVLVEDPLHEAENQPGHEQPSEPQDRLRADRVGARRPAPSPEQREPRDEGERQQPGDLRRDLGIEQPQQPGTVAERAATAHSSDLVAGDATEAVVAEQELDDAV